MNRAIIFPDEGMGMKWDAGMGWLDVWMRIEDEGSRMENERDGCRGWG